MRRSAVETEQGARLALDGALAEHCQPGSILRQQGLASAYSVAEPDLRGFGFGSSFSIAIARHKNPLTRLPSAAR